MDRSMDSSPGVKGSVAVASAEPPGANSRKNSSDENGPQQSRTGGVVGVPADQALRFAHDFNNLLTLVLGYSETILMLLPENQTVRPIAEEICRAAREGARLTQSLSTLAQGNSGSVK